MGQGSHTLFPLEVPAGCPRKNEAFHIHNSLVILVISSISCTLTIIEASPKEGGECILTAKNIAGSVTCAAKLTVKEATMAPKI
jgi:hypothetical protein